MTDEQAFLAAIKNQPQDDAAKLAYADWLEEQGDSRGEYLRGVMQLRQERSLTPEQRQQHQEWSAELAALNADERQSWANGVQRPDQQRRQRMQALRGQLTDLSRALRRQTPDWLQQLAATLDPGWLALVSDPNIESCARADDSRGYRLDFDLVCDKTWSELNPTDRTGVRHCQECQHQVYFCDNLADAREHAQQGHCIAVDLGIIRRNDDLQPPCMFLGRPSPETVRQTYEEDVDPVSQARLAARKQNQPDRKRRKRRK